MTRQRDPEALFPFARRYAAVSLLAILITATALTALYRELSIRTVSEFGERANITVARTALQAMRPELSAYLQAKVPVGSTATIESVPTGLLDLVRALVRDTPIERIKLYSRNGMVLYSTREYEIGTKDSANPRFRDSIQGQVRSILRYRDAFTIFREGNGDDNLIETYVPIRQPDKPRPVGVFELYTNVDPIARAMSQNALLILAGIATIMAILYGFLVFVVQRAQRIIADQRQTILERNRTLEAFSGRMLQAEEAERHRVAWELHEEIAQILSAAKAKAEALMSAAGQSQSLPGNARCGEIVPLLQSAIGDVRALAMDLRPPDLEDFGLIATTRSLCREAGQVEGQPLIVADIRVREDEIPEPLKSVIFRITQQTLKRLVRTPGISDICVVLKREEQLRLVIGFSAELGDRSDEDKSASATGDPPIADVWERAVLAGGTFSTACTESGYLLYQADWIL